jgi:dipeptidyl aminopeptidase/acylaminoacyl peptidase
VLANPPGPVQPAALVLFSALLDTSRKDLADRFSSPSRARKLSPLRQVRRKLPPILLCHGKRDRVTPFEDARRFARALRWRRNKVELLDFEQAEHAFFNFNVSEFYYELTLQAADRFLVDHGLLVPDEVPE